jgi:hypothetical protein
VFPTNGVLIAPFWADVDIRGIGSIYYRTTSNQTLLERFSDNISSSFSGQVTFSPQILFIATWMEVGYFNNRTDKVQYNYSQTAKLIGMNHVGSTEQYISMYTGYKWRIFVRGLPI